MLAILAALMLMGSEKRYAGRALAILGERYARGEINKEEYQQKKKDLAT